MRLPGITVRPLVDMTGEHHFNEVFFERVRVPKRWLIGERNRGWFQIASQLDYERAGMERLAELRAAARRSRRARSRERPRRRAAAAPAAGALPRRDRDRPTAHLPHRVAALAGHHADGRDGACQALRHRARAATGALRRARCSDRMRRSPAERRSRSRVASRAPSSTRRVSRFAAEPSRSSATSSRNAASACHAYDRTSPRRSRSADAARHRRCLTTLRRRGAPVGMHSQMRRDVAPTVATTGQSLDTKNGWALEAARLQKA